jgi:NAD(P)-dependent dehydrogenase (short-subunit alcohol dehydrogenase family)
MRIRTKLALGGLGLAGASLGVRALLRHRRKIVLPGRIVMVTGASSGLGLMIARQAAEDGARLVIAARDADELERAADVLRDAGSPEVLAVPTDVSDPEQVRRLVDRALARFGQVDILVNNAGTMLVGPAESLTTDDFRALMATNFWGQLHPILAVLPSMRARKFGRIVNVVSVGGKVAVPRMLAYTASKFALTGLSQGLRNELARDNILTTAVYPGTIRTGGHTHAWIKGDTQAEYTWFALSDTIPGLSASAEGAARKLWDATLHGDPEVVIGWNAKLAILANNLFPDWVAEVMAAVDQYLMPTPMDLHKPAVQGGDLIGKVPEKLSRMVPASARPGTVG